MKNVLCIGGGTGLPIVLKALNKIGKIKIYAVPTVFDDGGDTGHWRKKYNIPAVGDIRRCLVALSNDKKISELMEYRFEGDHHLGNMIIVQYILKYGFKEAIEKCKHLLKIKDNEIYPVSLDSVILWGENKKGEIISEGEFNDYKDTRIKKIYFDKKIKLNPKIKKIFSQIDYLVISPGSFYSSISSNLKVIDKKLLNRKKMTKIWISNLHTEPGETQGLSLQDHYDKLKKYIKSFDYVIANNNYRFKLKNRKYLKPIINDKEPKIIVGNFIEKRDYPYPIHSISKLTKVLRKVIK